MEINLDILLNESLKREQRLEKLISQCLRSGIRCEVNDIEKYETDVKIYEINLYRDSKRNVLRTIEYENTSKETWKERNSIPSRDHWKYGLQIPARKLKYFKDGADYIKSNYSMYYAWYGTSTTILSDGILKQKMPNRYDTLFKNNDFIVIPWQRVDYQTGREIAFGWNKILKLLDKKIFESSSIHILKNNLLEYEITEKLVEDDQMRLTNFME